MKAKKKTKTPVSTMVQVLIYQAPNGGMAYEAIPADQIAGEILNQCEKAGGRNPVIIPGLALTRKK